MEKQLMHVLNLEKAPEDMDLIELQKRLQGIVRDRADQLGRRIPVVTETARNLGELTEVVKANKLCIEMELAELLDVLPWKYWKLSNDYGPDERLVDQPELWLELVYEAIDIQHFLNNIYIALGVDTEQLRDVYYTKSIENAARQDRGY